MRIRLLVTALLLSGAAHAAEVNVLAAGLVGPGFDQLAAQWKAKTGNSVAYPGNGAAQGKIDQMVNDGTPAADLVLLPPADVAKVPGKLKPGSEKKIGRVLFALAVPAGSAHPDISTAEKFRAALKGKHVVYNDPAIGSLAGIMVDTMLKRPEYAGVNGGPSKGRAGQAVADGTADMAIAVVPEEVAIKGIDIIPIPDSVGLFIDVSGAVLANAAHPAEAAQFLSYAASPEASVILKPTGFAPPL